MKKYMDLTAIVGAIYFFMIKGEKRQVLCTNVNGNRYNFQDIVTNYVYSWHVAHFSYMLRKCSYAPVRLPGEPVTVTITAPKNGRAFKSKSYTPSELDALVDNIEDIEF